MRRRGKSVWAMLAAVVCAALGGALVRVEAEAASGDPPPAKSRLGINLNGPADWNTELPFVDVFRLSRKWISQRKGAGWGRGPELERDANGWVKRLEPDCWAETPLCTSCDNHMPAGNYVCLYEGEGEIDFNGHKRIVSREPGRVVVEIDGTRGFFLALRKTNPANHVRNIRVIMPGFEKDYQANPFHPVFLNRWKGFNTFRFMDWMQTNGSKISRWEERPTPEYCNFTERGVPVEMMIALCNRQKLNPWFCMPHLATDDYVRRFAERVKRDLDPSLRVYVEYSNEVWNSMFEQTRWCGEQGLKLKFAEKPWEAGWRYSSYRSVQMFKIWEAVFGGKDRLVRVMASQSAVPYIAEQKLSFQDAFKNCDALGIAPYMGFNIPAKSEKDRPGADTVAAWTVDQVLDHVERTSLPRAVKDMNDNRKIADKYGLKLVAYEAGQHLVGVGGGENNEPLTALLQAANRHPRMGALYTRYLDAWNAAGGDVCGIFASVGRWSKWGSWGVLEYYDETENDSPKFRAVLEWNRHNPRD